MWRENYNELGSFDLGELIEVASRGLGLLTGAGFDFRRLALEKITKYSRSTIVSLASVSDKGAEERNYQKRRRLGI